MKGYGFVKVFWIVSKGGDEEHCATDLIDMEEPDRKELAHKSWKIEEYHRGIKQFCGVERCHARNGKSQRTHIPFPIRAFLRLEVERIRTTLSIRLSICVAVFIGLGLNTLGDQARVHLFSIAAFALVFTAISAYRRSMAEKIETEQK